MKHQLPYYFSLCFVLLLLGAQAGFGQVTVNFVMSPRPSPYLSDWEQRHETAQLTVTNNDPYAETVIRIQASVSRNGEIVARTKQQSMPVLQLHRGQNTFIAVNIFPLAAVEFVGGIDKSAQRLGKLPEGNYSICVQLTDIETGAVIADAGCQSFLVLDVRPPQLIAPGIPATLWHDRERHEHATLDTRELAGPTIFQWLPATPVAETPRYIFRLFPVEPEQDPNTVTNSARPLYEMISLSPQLALTQIHGNGTGLAWNIQAIDGAGRPVGANNGMSETFYIPLSEENQIRSTFDAWVDLSDRHDHVPQKARYSTVAEFRASIARVESMSSGIKAYLDTLKNGQPNKRGRTEQLIAVARRILQKIDKGDIPGAVYDVFHFDSKTFSLISYIMKAEMAGDISSQRVTDIVSVIEVPPIPAQGFEPPLIPAVKIDTPKACVCNPKVKIRVTWTYIAPCGNYSRTTNGYAANNTLSNMSRGTMYKFTPEVSGCPHAGHWTSVVNAPAGASYGHSTGSDGSVTLLSESGGTYTVTFTWNCPCGPKASETFTINFK